jgi:hypothetical protein
MLVEPGRKLLVVLAYLPKLVVLGKQFSNPITPSRKSWEDEIQLVNLRGLRERPVGDYAFCDVPALCSNCT